ncbi:MAG: nucleotidyl transferase AbiEii/AbiGii toxin family protein [Alphaproteobacteria bacterium]|nr:nucleotidyl transferase AbiEii/AbiGii toxin family protein [Alphaproteobacteria bacterium]
MKNQYSIFAGMTNPTMAEKDFLECAILDKLFQDKFFAENFVFAGGGSITKSYAFSPRISQDLDLAYTAFCDIPDTPSRNQLKKFRKRFKTFIFETIAPRITSLIAADNKYQILTDREHCVKSNKEQWLSSPTIHILYKSAFYNRTEEIHIEIIPRKYSPSALSFHSVMPYALPGARFGHIPTVAYEQTFWDKVFALHSNALSAHPHTDAFYSRHYFDVARLAGRVDLDKTAHMLSDIAQYQEKYTTKRLGTDISPCDAILIPSDPVLYALESDYDNLAQQTFIAPKTSWNLIVQRLEQLSQDLKQIAYQR